MKTLTIALLMPALMACATVGSRMNRVSLGMDKGGVIDKMGEPDSVKAQGDTEVLVYKQNAWTTNVGDYTGEYWFVMKNGKLVQYGKPGDFRNTVPQTVQLNLHQN